jgi:hypothetical protein
VTFKDGNVVSVAQAGMQDELEDAKRNAPWVDITQGVELSEKLEHEPELRGWMQLLHPSHPKALNFNEEQSFKSLGTAGTNASLYTSTQSVSLGGTAFEPWDDEEVDSQESPIFGGSDSSKAEDNLEDDTEGVFIENMGAFSLGLTNTSPAPDGQETGKNAEPNGAEPGQGSLVHSPGKVTLMASISSGFSTGVSEDHSRDIQEMIREWIDGNDCHNILAHLAYLARRAHVDINKFTTPQQRGQRDKNLSTPTAAEGAREGILTDLQFVLTGVWPYQGSGHSLTLGKERVKSRIEKFGGTVTMSFLHLCSTQPITHRP